MALFGEKYGDRVRVVIAGLQHGAVRRHARPRHRRHRPFVITEEGGVAAGVRRIEASPAPGFRRGRWQRSCTGRCDARGGSGGGEAPAGRLTSSRYLRPNPRAIPGCLRAAGCKCGPCVRPDLLVARRRGSARRVGPPPRRPRRDDHLHGARLVGRARHHASRLSARASEFDEVIEEQATAQGVAPELVRAVIQVESAFDARAVSSKGAMGLMQLMPATARELGAYRTPSIPRRISAAESPTSGSSWIATTATSSWHWPPTTPDRAAWPSTARCRPTARRRPM
jgi:hypothetical protein